MKILHYHILFIKILSYLQFFCQNFKTRMDKENFIKYLKKCIILTCFKTFANSFYGTWSIKLDLKFQFYLIATNNNNIINGN